jgi:hypothetical protein
MLVAVTLALVALGACDSNRPAGGRCTYRTIRGTCSLTRVGAAPMMTFTGTVDGALVTLPDNPVAHLTGAFTGGLVGATGACTIDLEVEGACTPCTTSLGECGAAALDTLRAHKPNT